MSGDKQTIYHINGDITNMRKVDGNFRIVTDADQKPFFSKIGEPLSNPDELNATLKGLDFDDH